MLEEILNYLPKEIKSNVLKASNKIENRILELRLRVNQPLELITFNKNFFINDRGSFSNKYNYYKIKPDILKKTFIILTEHSIYAVEKELKEGFITIKGGHRVGFTGEVIIKNNKIFRIKNINSLNFRINHQIIGVGEKIIKYLYNRDLNSYYSTLIVGPPFSGKTTLLRDLIRLCSTGKKEVNIKSFKVGVVDERSEIGGSYKGIPQNNLGMRTDLLDKCPKSRGILMLIRTMSPEVVAVDEIGSKNDIEAITRALNSGVIVLATLHGYNYESICNQPIIGEVIRQNVFKRIVILNNTCGIGTIQKVLDGKGGSIIAGID